MSLKAHSSDFTVKLKSTDDKTALKEHPAAKTARKCPFLISASRKLKQNSPFVIWLTVVTSSNRALKCTNPANFFHRLKSRKKSRPWGWCVLTLDGREWKVLCCYFNNRVPLRASQRRASQREKKRAGAFPLRTALPKRPRATPIQARGRWRARATFSRH